MKLNKKLIYQWIVVICSAILSFYVLFSLVLFSLASCSDSKLVAYHLKKAEKHGGKIVCDTTFIEVPKLVKGKDGKDSLIYVQTPIPCAPCQPCEEKESRFEIKWKYKYDLKRQKARDAFLIDSLKESRKKEVKLSLIEAKHAIKQIKNETKQKTANNKSWNITMIVLGLIALILLILFIYYKIST